MLYYHPLASTDIGILSQTSLSPSPLKSLRYKLGTNWERHIHPLNRFTDVYGFPLDVFLYRTALGKFKQKMPKVKSREMISEDVCGAVVTYYLFPAFGTSSMTSEETQSHLMDTTASIPEMVEDALEIISQDGVRWGLTFFFTALTRLCSGLTCLSSFELRHTNFQVMFFRSIPVNVNKLLPVHFIVLLCISHMILSFLIFSCKLSLTHLEHEIPCSVS